MELKNMRDSVLEEMEYIPKHPKPQQSYLRMIYFTSRMHSLGRKAKEKKAAADVLRESLAYLRSEYPGSEFRYDEAFFNGTRRSP